MKDRVKYAFIKSLPVLFGYVFLGIAFGIVLEEAGYNYIWALFMSVWVFGGSIQFVMVPLLASAAPVITVALTALFVQSRHLFYGLSFIESFKKLKARPYLIFSLSDETYSVLIECKNEDPNEEKADSWVLIALFDQCYWIIGSIIGGILGQALPFDFTGIDFSMTALFVVILLEQLLSDWRNRWVAAISGIVVSIIGILVLGNSGFLLPSLIIIVLIVSVYTEVRNRRGIE